VCVGVCQMSVSRLLLMMMISPRERQRCWWLGGERCAVELRVDVVESAPHLLVGGDEDGPAVARGQKYLLRIRCVELLEAGDEMAVVQDGSLALVRLSDQQGYGRMQFQKPLQFPSSCSSRLIRKTHLVEDEVGEEDEEVAVPGLAPGRVLVEHGRGVAAVSALAAKECEAEVEQEA
jgi:hypothetical protein